MKKALIFCVPVLAGLAILIASCAKEPVLSGIQATIDGYKVSFSASASNTETWLWDFGDGNTSTEAAPVHEYLKSGTYTVNLTASGKGGEVKATKQIEITPSVTELLSGGPTVVNGKTWVLSNGYTEGKDGAGAVDNSMSVILPSMPNMLVELGLNDEYDNEYTFYSDGRYKVDVKNGIALTASIYGQVNKNIVNYGSASNNLGIYGGTYTAPASASWTLHNEDLMVDAITNPLGTDVPAPHAVQTITGKKWVSLSEGAFFGILDFSTTRKFIIEDIKPDEMHVALFICGYLADENAWTIPAYLFHVTYVPKK